MENIDAGHDGNYASGILICRPRQTKKKMVPWFHSIIQKIFGFWLRTGSGPGLG
jgi:hypothetical protein